MILQSEITRLYSTCIKQSLRTIFPSSYSTSQPTSIPTLRNPCDAHLLPAYYKFYIYSPLAHTITKRTTDSIHMVNCYLGGLDIYSVVIYCPNDNFCSNTPSSSDICEPNPGGVSRWPPSTTRGECTFSTGIAVSWGFVPGAIDYEYVG